MSLADLLNSSQPTETEKKKTQPAASGGSGLSTLLQESSPIETSSRTQAPAPVLPDAKPEKKGGIVDAVVSGYKSYSEQVQSKAAAFDSGALQGVSTLVSGFQWLTSLADTSSLSQTEKTAFATIQKKQAAGEDASKLISSLNVAVEARTGFKDWYGDFTTKEARLSSAASKLQEWGDTLKKSTGITPDNQTLTESIFEAAGSSAIYFVPGIGVARGAKVMAAVSPRIALLFGNSAMTGLEAMSEAGSVYQSVKQDGGDEQKAIDAANKGFMINAVLIGITNQIGITNPARLGAIKRALLSAPVEGFQEAAQQVTQNVTTGKPVWDGVLQSGAIGAILGPFLGGAADIVAGGEAAVAPKKPVSEAGGETKPRTSANENVNATVKLATQGASTVRDEIQTLTLQQQLNPTNSDIAAQLGALRAQLDDYFQVAHERAVNSTEPLLQIDTLKYDDGKFGFSANAAVDQNQFSVPISASEIFATKEEATTAALDAVKAWAKTQSQATEDANAKASYQRIVEAATPNAKPEAQPAPKNAPEAGIREENGKYLLVNEKGTIDTFDTKDDTLVRSGLANRAGEQFVRLKDIEVGNIGKAIEETKQDIREGKQRGDEEYVRNTERKLALLEELKKKNEKPVEKPKPAAKKPSVEDILRDAITSVKANNEFNTLAQATEGKDFAALGKRQKANILAQSKRPLFITDPDAASSLVTPTYKSDVFNLKPELLYGGIAKGMFTDSYQLITDKAAAEKINTKEREARIKRDITIRKRNMPDITHEQAEKEARADDEARAREYADIFPKIEQILPKEKGKPVTIEAVTGKSFGNDWRGELKVIGKIKGGERVAFNLGYFANMRAALPDAGLHMAGHGKPLEFWRGDKIAGLLMPFNTSSDDIKAALKTEPTELPKTPSGNAMAIYRPEDLPDFPVKMGGMDQTHPIEFPELVDIARDIMGKVPEIVKKTGDAAGRFKAISGDTTSTRILLVAELFEKGNLREATKVLAHEIGHLIDYLPEGTLKRGNIVGRLKTLNNFMGEYFGTEGALDTKALRNEATREVLAENNVKFGDYITNKAVREELAPKIKERYAEKITASGGIRNTTIRNELLAVTRYWHPYDTENVPESYKRYRESSKELYAEAVSMLFNSPGLLEQMAPTFYGQFFKGLDAKPDVRDAYFKVQELMSGDRETLVRLRRAGVQKMFEEGDYKAGELNNERHAERERRNRDVRFRLRFELVDKNSRIIDLVDQLEKKGIHVNPDDNPVYYLEERNYLGGKIKAVMERDFNPIYQRIQDSGLSWNDFGELLFYERIVAGDRSEQANPRGITPEAAQELIDAMKAQYGADSFNTLEQSANDFRSAVKKIATEAHSEGLYTDELYKQMLENPAYVTFQVIEHIEDGVSSRVYKSIGTLKDITNPADASLLKIIATLRAIERNKVNTKAIEMLQEYHPAEVEEAKYRYSGKSREPVRPKGQYQELVTLYEKGKLKGFYVDPYIQKSLDNESIGGNNALIRGIRFFNSTTFRPLFITFNLGFQSFNLIRDFLRFYKNIPGMTLIRTLKRYKQASRISRVRAFGARNNTEDQAAFQTLQQLEYDQVLSVTFNDILSGYNEEEKQIERILRESGIDSFKPQEGSKYIKPLKAVLLKIEELGNMIETLPKAAGYYEFTDQNGGAPLSKEQASFIRKNIGSPDFLAGGNIKPATNEIFLFSNAITQGIRSDYNIAVDPKTRSGFWWKTTKIQFLPKILMAAALAGAFGDELKKMFEGVSEYDMANYIVVPIGIDANGKTIYLRIPVDETSRFLGGIQWKAMMAVTGKNQQSVGKNIMDIASYTGGQLPSLSPVLEVGSATLQYLGGANPYDAFKGRQVLSDQVYQAGGLISAKAYAGWVFQQLGGGVFVRFYYEPTTPEVQSGVEKAVNLPVIGNILGRFVRVSDYGRQEKLQNIQKQIQQQEARASIKERETVNKYIKQAQQSGVKLTGTLKDKLVNDVLGHTPQTSDELAHAGRIKKKFDLGLKRGSASPEVTALIDADTNKQKLGILQKIRAGLSQTEWQAFRSQIDDVVSDAVLYDPSLK